MTKFTEDTVEQATIDWLKSVGYKTIQGAIIVPNEQATERASYGDVFCTS